jgi:hypothetical protein
MAIRSIYQKPEESFQEQVRSEFKKRPLYGVGQDNNAPERVRVAFPQAVPPVRPSRNRALDTNSDRPRKRSTKRRTVIAAGWIKRPVSEEIDRIAKGEGLTRSKVIATLLEEAVHQKLHVQHALLLEPIIRQAIAREMGRDRARFAALLVRIAFDANTTRHLAGNILGRQPGVTPERLNRIRDWSTRKAKESITTRSPQIEELLAALDTWLSEAGEEEKDRT